MDPLPARIGPYDVQREIGRGGMGIVYLARETTTAKMVALKVLPREWTSDPVRLKRFRREALTAARVRHPNVVPMLAVGEFEGLHYLAMRYVPGTSLDVLIRDQAGAKSASDEDTVVLERVSSSDAGGAAHARPRRAAAGPRIQPAHTTPLKPVSEPQWVYRGVRIVEKIARALGHLHQHGIVHRDVKPGNILIDQRGDPWLADFGLVRDLDAESMSDDEGILGTVQYIAPEQIERDRGQTDHRSDLYSLGVTLYELVTLRRPFDGRGTSSTLYAVAQEAPLAPRRINPGLSSDLEIVIQKAMAKNPDDRYQTGAEFADDLRRVRTFRPVHVARASLWTEIRNFCARSPLLAGAMVFALLSFVGMLEYGIYCELSDRRRLFETRAEADALFERGDLRDAAEGYRLYLKLGGRPSAVNDRLAMCREDGASRPTRR